jgi:hypothetical protein
MGLFGGTQNTQNSRLLGYRVQTSISGTAIPIVFGTNRIPANVIWTGDWKAKKAEGKAGKGKAGGNYTYTTAGIEALCSGPINSIVAVWSNQIKKGQDATSYLSPYTVSDLGLTLFVGNRGQAPWGYLTSNHADQALGYSEIAYVAKSDWDLGSSGVFPNYSYEIAGFDRYGGGMDAAVSAVIERLLTDESIGAGFDPAEVDITECASYCLANSLFVSPVLDQQKSCSEWVNQLLLVSNCEAVWSEGILKIKSRGDLAATGNSTTFTPNLTPVANLSDENGDFKDKEEPVRIMRPNPRDAYNGVTINWTNRANQYNTEPLQEMDQGAIDAYGYRPASAIDALGICRADVASKTAHIQLKRNIYARTKYKFKLGFEHILLEPMDVVTLTCTVNGVNYQRLNQTAVRLLSIAEDQDGYLDCEAEEILQGAGTPNLNPQQTGGGYTPPTTVDAGDILEPIFYEGTREMRQLLYGTPYALLMALTGGPNWAGCTVYRSWDNLTYELVGRQTGSTPRGVLSAGLASATDPDSTNTLSVSLLESGAELATVTQADADNFKTLSVIGGGPTSELISFETATLTGTNAYNLTYLRRGIYQSPIAAHNSGDPFFVVKNAFAWIYQSQDVGKTVYFKFASFNATGATTQDLSTTTAYSYTLTGGLSAVKTITADYTLEPSDVALNVDTTAGAVTITIPDAVATVNTTTVITKISADTNQVVTAGEPISGQTSRILTTEYDSMTIESTDAGWVMIAGPPSRFADNETPSGAMDGTNPTFTLLFAPTPIESLRLYYDGIEQLQGADISVTGNTITFLRAANLPDDAYGESLRAFYRY